MYDLIEASLKQGTKSDAKSLMCAKFMKKIISILFSLVKLISQITLPRIPCRFQIYLKSTLENINFLTSKKFIFYICKCYANQVTIQSIQVFKMLSPSETKSAECHYNSGSISSCLSITYEFIALSHSFNPYPYTFVFLVHKYEQRRT